MTEKKVHLLIRIIAILMIIMSGLKLLQGDYNGLNLWLFVALYVVAVKKINAFLKESRLTTVLVFLAVGLQVVMLVLSKVI
ncbi:hypothetical protein HZR21_00200 [Lactococcus laudensis]|uniref:DUF3953 domain-containing protein n=1 Tax=Pseudolactococcus laudensis TaxID=1494461 RepID=A0A7V8SIT4_9LACT|nr:hypothetical protein [Lactococcus laudensis]MBA0015586.1 hypothetical protein [Lactococcus laudensis]MBQ6145172.1 hypothetical protein [Lactococcus sp.]MBR2763257.1 hypothetical protein [Lactococcus sp.]MBW9280678.1 hypothetical protein [Lactococcus laudensis]